jgi:putative addiction module killer protein
VSVVRVFLSSFSREGPSGLAPFSPLTNSNKVVTMRSWMIEVRGYIDGRGSERFARWFAELDPHAAAKVTIACTRLEKGNFSNVKSVGAGVYEYKIDFGPGYRIYFAKDGDRLVILIGGGTKKRNASRRTSPQRRNAGLITNEGRNRSRNNATYSRFQGNHSRADLCRP